MDNSKAICPKCKGRNYTGYDFCPLCEGKGEVDWITGITGKKPVIIEAHPYMIHILEGGITIIPPSNPKVGDMFSILYKNGTHELKKYTGDSKWVTITRHVNL